MVDITAVNKQVRKHLDRYGYTDVILDKPHYDGMNWYVIVITSDHEEEVLGTVILSSTSEVMEGLSFPTAIDKAEDI